MQEVYFLWIEQVWVMLRELFLSGLLAFFGVLSITFILLGFKIMNDPDYEKKRQELLRLRRRNMELQRMFWPTKHNRILPRFWHKKD